MAHKVGIIEGVQACRTIVLNHSGRTIEAPNEAPGSPAAAGTKTPPPMPTPPAPGAGVAADAPMPPAMPTPPPPSTPTPPAGPGSAVSTPAAGDGGGGTLPPPMRELLAALPPPKVRGKMPPRKWGKMESREEVGLMLAAAAAAADVMEYELAMRGYLRAFEVTRSLPLMLSVINMHLKMGELDVAQSYADVVQEQSAATSGLTAEQKAVLAKKMGEITVTRQRAVSEAKSTEASHKPSMNRRVSVWQQKLDNAQIELLNQKK